MKLSCFALIFFAVCPILRADLFTVTNLDGGNIPGSFRWAMEQSNLVAGPNTIDLTGVQGEINLSASPPAVNRDLTIRGPGADRLTIVGNHIIVGTVGATLILIEDLTFEGGGAPQAGASGGGVLTASALTMRRCHLKGFEALDGGALYCRGTLILSSSTFSNNTATGRGGGVAAEGTSTITSCTFSGNSAGTQGGGLAVVDNDLCFAIHCTFYQNDAGTDGAAVHSVSNFTQVDSSIAAGNSIGGLVDDSSQIGGPTTVAGINVLEGDPKLYPLRKYEFDVPYHLPRFESPAIDRIANPAVANDARGNPRNANIGADVGAIEARYAEVQTTASSGAGSFAEAVAQSNLAGPRLDLIHLDLEMFQQTAVVNLTSALPILTRGSSFSGGYNVGISGQGNHRIFDVAATATVSCEDLFFISGNAGLDGGGAFRIGGVVYLEGCRLSGNIAGFGGAIRVNAGGQLEASRCSFAFNGATHPTLGDSGAVEIAGHNAVADFYNCQFDENGAKRFGGAIGVFGASNATRVNVVHCTFMENSTDQAGGGGAIYNTSAYVGVRNAFFVGNLGDGGESHTVFSSNPFDETCNLRTAITATVQRDMAFGRADWLLPAVGSPALEYGDPDWAIDTDLRRVGRPLNGRPDAGAIEREQNAYEVWASKQFGPSALCQPQYDMVSGPRADPDNDKRNNVWEMVSDSDPNRSDVGQVREEWGLIFLSGQDFPYFSIDVCPDPFDGFLTLVGEISMDHSSWQSQLIDTFILPGDTTKVTKRILSSDAIDAQPRQFFRFRITGLGAFHAPFAGIGEPGNADEPVLGVGGVAEHYSIGKFEITTSQWVAFLNANDPTGANVRQYWNANQNISLDLSRPESERYQTTTAAALLPIFHINFYDACRFCNWLHHGSPISNALWTEGGAYELASSTPIPSNAGSIVRSPGARYAIPTLDEWVKAAHYVRNGNYSVYPNGEDSANNQFAPGNRFSMNYSALGLNTVGSYPSAKGAWGAFDMGGSVAEWIEDGPNSSTHYHAGGAWNADLTAVANPLGTSGASTSKSDGLGLRVVRIK